ncbi:MAG: transglycosylase domain-containing protein, partial [Lachnospiraceae bacterium]|nr:transglycosylase domain-containing protein [Lachnospiraceae bacterium]
DERFYEHNGIDIQGIIRAGIVGITSGDLSQGASTLTQQLIKNNVFPNFVNEKTLYDRVERKLQEQFLAIQIEKQMDKDAIMESYLNTINLGQNCLGVQAAAKRYFGKDVSELNLSECAVIAGITQSPGKLNPITNPEDNAKRRKKVLGDMKAQGYIDQAAYDEAMADDVYSRIQTVNNTAADNSPYTYFIDALSSQVMDDLMIQLGYTETQAYTAVYSGGLSIYSTQNLAIQQICDEEVNNDANYPSLKEYGLDCAITVTRADGTVENYSSGHIKQYVKNAHGNEQGLLYPSEEAARAMVEEWKTTIAQEGDTYDERINVTPQPQASITVIDQATGQIKAMVGGRGAKATSLGLNRAYKGSKRQPGSCFKILAAYGPALDSCGKSLATVIKDEPYTLRNGKVLRNANGRYGGDTTIRKAIIWSNNVCAVKLSDEITQQLGFEYCEKFGITTLVKSKTTENGVFSDLDNQTLALGGLTDGVFNYEICAAYAAIANNGVYNSPTLYS